MNPSTVYKLVCLKSYVFLSYKVLKLLRRVDAGVAVLPVAGAYCDLPAKDRAEWTGCDFESIDPTLRQKDFNLAQQVPQRALAANTTRNQI